jgi:hypothetical protein
METKVMPKPLHKEPIEPSPRILGSLIKLVEQEVDSWNSYEELVELINSRFNVEITVDTLIQFYQVDICQKENEHLYKLYGYEKD